MEKEKPSYYAIIPAEVRYDPNLKDKAKLLYGEITALTNKNCDCYATNQYFADLYKISTTTVSLLIKNLKENGYIESKITYKEGTKEILNRYLKIVKDPYLRKLKYPPQEKLKDSITSNSNTSINNIPPIIPQYEIMFNTFWEEYPRKESKLKAKEKFMKIKPSEETFNKIIDMVNYYKNSKQWQKNNGEFIPHATTWLNQERWNDEIAENESLPTWFNQEITREGVVYDDETIAFAKKIRGEE